MLDVQGRQRDLTASDRAEESGDADRLTDGVSDNRFATRFDRRENVSAAAPRLFCMGFAVIRI